MIPCPFHHLHQKMEILAVHAELFNGNREISMHERRLIFWKKEHLPTQRKVNDASAFPHHMTRAVMVVVWAATLVMDPTRVFVSEVTVAVRVDAGGVDWDTASQQSRSPSTSSPLPPLRYLFDHSQS